jgi:two-component system sensor histidine kinase UhpB
MSLKLRLNLAISLVLAVMLLAGGVFLLRAARMDVRAEIQSAATLAMHVLDGELARTAAGAGELPRFGLASLGAVRHLRIELYDAAGRLVETNHAADDPPARVPAWFASLVGDPGGGAPDMRRTVSIAGRAAGELVVRPDPSFEVEEIWDDAVRIAKLALVLFAATNALTYWMVARALRPVDSILGAITELERGNLSARLPPIALPELARIGREFNRMTDSLQATARENRQLTQQVMRVQEEERRSLARELHDELGQGLSAIQADAVAVLNATKRGQPAPHESAQAIIEVARGIMALVRGMLQRLHPEALETLGLAEALHELVAGWRQRNPGTTCDLAIDGSLGRLGGGVDIAVYRIVQEALTNVARHAHAKHAEVRIRRTGGPAPRSEALTVEIGDDGAGMATPSRTGGFGLAGMRERIEGLGGSMHVDSEAGGGTTLRFALPLPRASAAA